jgi:hypothetical protein
MTAYDADPQHDRVHRRMWELLPWYVNGTLDGHERQDVEAHLGVCPACQAELVRCRDVAEAIRTVEDPAWAPSHARLLRVMARIDAAEAQPARAWGWWQRWRAYCLGYRTMLRPTFPFVRWGLAAQGASILLLVGVAAWQALFPSETFYYTPSDRGDQTPQVHGQIRAVFANDMTEQELSTLLSDIAGTISNGPSALGVYTVDIAGAARAPERLGEVLDTLHAHPKVRLAEPLVMR